MEEFGDVADCWPERPPQDACVVLGDKKVWATCWNGGWGGVAKNSAMSPIGVVGPWRTKLVRFLS